jgi:hypothetical protein
LPARQATPATTNGRPGSVCKRSAPGGSRGLRTAACGRTVEHRRQRPGSAVPAPRTRGQHDDGTGKEPAVWQRLGEPLDQLQHPRVDAPGGTRLGHCQGIAPPNSRSARPGHDVSGADPGGRVRRPGGGGRGRWPRPNRDRRRQAPASAADPPDGRGSGAAQDPGGDFKHIGSVQLPDLLLEVDAARHFSEALLAAVRRRATSCWPSTARSWPTASTSTPRAWAR